MQQAPAETAAPVKAAAESAHWLCDFCGARAETVRRVTLDAGYDRLLRPHRERYACPQCSAQKERARIKSAAALDSAPRAG